MATDNVLSLLFLILCFLSPDRVLVQVYHVVRSLSNLSISYDSLLVCLTCTGS